MKINLLNAFPGDDPTCKRIPLSQGQSTLVSAEDYERLSQNPWQAAWNPLTETFYAQRSVRRDGKRTTLFAHREIMGLEPGDPRHVDHVNHDTLDNRRENLRIVTCRENHENRRDQSPYGVGVRKTPAGRFEARARIRGRRYHVGMFDTPEEAQKARRLYVETTSIPLSED